MKHIAHSQAAKNGRRTSAQRKIIVYIATSADGYIARPDGNVTGLAEPPEVANAAPAQDAE